MSEAENFPMRLPALWKMCFNGNIAELLFHEPYDYHKYCKNPDTGISFRKFYTHIEALHLFASKKYYHENYQGGQPKCISELSRISLNLPAISVNAKQKIIIFLGPPVLANFEVLKKQILNLSQNEKLNIQIFFLDQTKQDAFHHSKSLGVSCHGIAQPNLDPIKARFASYVAIAEYLFVYSHLIRSCNWWSIPFGMIFTYSLAKRLLVSNSKNLSLSLEYTTVKHHYSFSSKYLTAINTALPLVEGFENLDAPKINYFEPSFYTITSLTPDISDLSPRDRMTYDFLYKLKKSGRLILSSVSRHDKTSGEDYHRQLINILKAAPMATLVIFGKKIPEATKDILNALCTANQVAYIGWVNNASAFISLIDIFLDPFPFGAGMTFASAAIQNKPCISVVDYVNSSPSTISILSYYDSNNRLQVSKSCLSYFLFGSKATYAERALEAISRHTSNDLVLKDYCARLKHDIYSIFISSTTSIFRHS